MPKDVRGKMRKDERRILSGIVHALKCGGRWADCADVYGPRRRATIANCFVRWLERGIWEDICSTLAEVEGMLDRISIDSSCIKIHRCASGGKRALAHDVDRTKGGRNTKLQAICYEKSRPWVLLLTPRNVNDCKVAQLCIAAVPPSAELVANKGYDSQALCEWLEARLRPTLSLSPI